MSIADPIRQAHLNHDLEGKAGRRLGMFLGGEDGVPGMRRDKPRFVGAPTDSFEARHIEKDFGIKFVGDDYSSLKPKNQRAIEKAKEAFK